MRNVMTSFLRTIVASAIFTVAVPAHASFDLLLSIPGVDGYYLGDYKPDPGTPIPVNNWNKALSFEAGYDQDGCGEVNITMGTSDATAQIIANGIMGTINSQIYLHAVNNGAESSYPLVYYTLNNAVIASVSDSGSDGDDMVETTLTILPTSITVESFTQDKGGKTISSGEATIPCTGKIKTK
jgi:type VI protein secretion system component Hcp